MLTTSPADLLRLFWDGFLLGVAFGIAYDLLRITRVLMGVRYGARTAGRLAALPMPYPACSTQANRVGQRLRDGLVNLEDLLYFLFVGPAIAIYLSAANHGRVRWLAFAGIGLGFAAYRLTVGRLVIGCSAAIAAGLRFLLAWMIWGLCRPVCWLGKLVRQCSRCLARRLRAIWNGLYLPVYTRCAMRRDLRRLKQAFRKSEMEGST